MSAHHTPGKWRDMGHHMIGVGSGSDITIVCECWGADSADELEANKANTVQ